MSEEKQNQAPMAAGPETYEEAITRKRRHELAWAVITYLGNSASSLNILKGVRQFLLDYAGGRYVAVRNTGRCREYDELSTALVDADNDRYTHLVDLAGEMPTVNKLISESVLRVGPQVVFTPGMPSKAPPAAPRKPELPRKPESVDDEDDDEELVEDEDEDEDEEAPTRRPHGYGPR